MSAPFAKLQQIDLRFYQLLNKVELLLYINPINAEKERQKFYKSGYSIDPVFRYPKCTLNLRAIRKELFKLKMQKIENEAIAELYEQLRWYFNGILDCVEHVGEKELFLRSSLKTFGAPSALDLQRAHALIKASKSKINLTSDQRLHTTEEALEYMNSFVNQYGFNVTVKSATHMSSKAMVSNSKKSVILKRGERFSALELEALANHEIGVHLVTTFNAENQRLKIFSLGFPFNVQTQEGLAVLAEYYSGALNFDRIFELAVRVVLADNVIKGQSFAASFDQLVGEYKLSRDHAFKLVTRLYRGGGFTKDRLYLPGFIELIKQHPNEETMNWLLAGKTASDYQYMMPILEQQGLINPNTYQSTTFNSAKPLNKEVAQLIQRLV
ncbi:MAG: tyrosine/phenylalanine carboxypeptidase domain-containing protein [Flavobacteriaceae bacterium]